jgi:hypothetical protein
MDCPIGGWRVCFFDSSKGQPLSRCEKVRVRRDPLCLYEMSSTGIGIDQ